MANSWDNGVEGNYWSDYAGDNVNREGIGNIPYTMSANNTDNYPLMGMYHSYNVSGEENVWVVSNSSIQNLSYHSHNNTIKMTVSNVTTNQTVGFCRISIPHALMTEPYTVVINGGDPTYWNYSIYDDGTHRWLYFEYEHSTIEIIIIPEFPSAIILLLLLLLSTVISVLGKKLAHTSMNYHLPHW